MIRRLLETLRPRRNNADIDDELAFHIAMRAREFEQSGMTPAEAQREARKKFGGQSALREETREAHVFQPVDTLLREARYSFRSLAKRPALWITGSLTLALGIGANLAIFAIVDALLLRPLPILEPERFFVIAEQRSGAHTGGNVPRMRAYAEADAVESIGGFFSERVAVAAGSGSRGLKALRTSGDVLRTFGYKLTAGRNFTEAEQNGEGNAVLLGHFYWQREFAGAADVIGRTLQTQSGALQIIGVLPPEASLIEDHDLWLPSIASVQNGPATAGYLQIITRLKPGMRPERANAQIAAAAAEFREITARLTPLNDVIANEARTPILLLVGVVVTLLLVACANLAGLLIARNTERARELSIRLSIGAGRWDLLRLLFMESMWIAALGGALGILAGKWLLDIIVAQLPADLLLTSTIALDWRAFGAAVVLTCFAALFAGLLPAWQAARLKRRSGRLRNTLVAGQIAVSTVLVSTAILLVNTLLAARQRPFGFVRDHVVAIEFDMPWSTDGEKLKRFYEAVDAAASELPGVRAAGIVDRLPLQGGGQGYTYTRIRGVALDEATARQAAGFRAISNGYFAALRIPLLRGRWAEPRQREIVINESFAKRYFGGADPIGASISFSRPTVEPKWYTVVGVAGNVVRSAMDPSFPAETFVHHSLTYWPQAALVIHGEGDPDALLRAALARVHQIDPYVLTKFSGTLDAKLETSWSEPNLLTSLVAATALLALLLVSLGVYGVTASAVRSRTRELGIRAALGATPRILASLSLFQALRIAAIGILIGSAGAFAVPPLIAAIIPGRTAFHASELAGAIAVMAGLVALASTGPARRAARVDPAITLRHE
jgi:predicted permease